MTDFDPEFDKLPDKPVTIGGDKSAAAWHPVTTPETENTLITRQVKELVDRWHDVGGSLAEQIGELLINVRPDPVQTRISRQRIASILHAFRQGEMTDVEALNALDSLAKRAD